MASTYDKGDLVRLQGVFTSSTGGLINPTSVKLFVEDPAGTVTTYASLTHETDGYYYRDILVASSGLWEYRFTSTGTGQASQEAYFIVRAQRVST